MIEPTLIEPPLKWVGGKNRVKETIAQYTPPQVGDYHEPFLGSGAIFIYLKQNCVFKNWFLSDANPHLICWWLAMQNDFHTLLAYLRQIKQEYETGSCKDKYHYFRKQFNEYPTLDTYKAALFMFLARTAFNGLIRYNKNGDFNAAWGNQTSGRYKDAFVFCENQLLALHLLLQENVYISQKTYSQTTPSENDFVFCDPPYDAIETRQIDKLTYNQSSFDRAQQILFANWCSQLDQQNIHFMVCNHDTDFVRSHFAGFHFVEYKLMKSFSGKATARQNTSEVLIMNYKTSKHQD